MADGEPNKSSALDSVDNECWGWLEPSNSSVLLPYISLTGNGAAIGRGKEAFEQRIASNEQANTWTNQLFTGRSKGWQQYKDLNFVEVADGRVSRMHCVVIHKKGLTHMEPHLEDCSSNGTFINDRKVEKGRLVKLNNGDKISLVMSVAPMSEQYYLFHEGSPCDRDRLKFKEKEASLPDRALRRSLSKWPTCRYTSAEQCTLEDFTCQICWNPLKDCVTIEPCGHNFCAICLSNYVSSKLSNGEEIICPLRCSNPQRIVKNDTVRNLVDKKKRESERRDASFGIDDELDGIIEDELATVSPICPLTDEVLPLEVEHLRPRQIEVTLQRLASEDNDVSDNNDCLEVLARLCWGDDNSRKAIADSSGIALIKSVMEKSLEEEGIQCSGCLALMSLVRGEGSVCQWNQWEIARSGAVEVVGKAMRRHVNKPMVQLSAMLCFIPLALDNPMIQAHLTQTVQSDILKALDLHPNEADVQCKGLIVLGILAQREDIPHDASKARQMEAGMTRRIINALQNYGSSNEEVFWGALFALATLAREGSPRYNCICRNLSSLGVLKLLKEVINSYEERMRQSNLPTDDTIMAAARYLVYVISDADRNIKREWHTIFLGGLGLGLLVGSICCFVALKKRTL